jgi:hypothetical protein
LGIGLRACCAASGFFQFLVGYSENKEFLFFGLVEGVISSVGMVVHGNWFLPSAPSHSSRCRFEHNRHTRMADSVWQAAKRVLGAILGIFAAIVCIEKPAEAAENYATNPASAGLFAGEPGNLCLRKTAWWGWEDSNFQPNDYQPPELND